MASQPLYSTNYGQIRKDKIRSGIIGNLESVVHTAPVQNGQVFGVGSLVAGQRDLKNLAVPTTASIASDRLFVAGTPEVTYFAGQTNKDFVNATGSAILAYALESGDVVTITTNVIDNSTGAAGSFVGQYVAPQNGSLNLVVSATKPTTRFVGQIVEETSIYGSPASPAFTIQVIAN